MLPLAQLLLHSADHWPAERGRGLQSCARPGLRHPQHPRVRVAGDQLLGLRAGERAPCRRMHRLRLFELALARLDAHGGGGAPPGEAWRRPAPPRQTRGRLGAARRVGRLARPAYD